MTVATAEDPAPGGDTPSAWLPAARAGSALGCGHAHGPSGGRLDESARRLSHEEFAVAALLAGEGHLVRSLAEPRRGGRQADLSVCGQRVEVKSFTALPDRDREPGPRSVFNKLVDAAGQAPHVVLVGTGSGLSAGSVRQGLARYSQRSGVGGTLRSIRALGDGYDLAWATRPERQVERPVERVPDRSTIRPPDPGPRFERGL